MTRDRQQRNPEKGVHQSNDSVSDHKLSNLPEVHFNHNYVSEALHLTQMYPWVKLFTCKIAPFLSMAIKVWTHPGTHASCPGPRVSVQRRWPEPGPQRGTEAVLPRGVFVAGWGDGSWGFCQACYKSWATLFCFFWIKCLKALHHIQSLCRSTFCDSV